MPLRWTRKKQIVIGILLVLLVWAVWSLGRSCFIGVKIGGKVPWGYCTKNCTYDRWIAAPWHACSAAPAGRSAPPCTGRTASVDQLLSLSGDALAT